MSFVIINFEFNDPQGNPDELDKFLPKLGNPCHVLANTRIIKTNKKQDEILQSLQKNVFQQQDRFIVATLTEPWLAYNCKTSGPCYEESGLSSAEDSRIRTR